MVQEETLGGDRYVYGLDGSDGFMDVHSSSDSLQYAH